ncbi:hypothetical protein Ciccas_010785, partial [Cichlidogyrus casuarinus]
SLFDEAQLQINQAPLMQPGDPQKLSYIQNLGSKVAQSLLNLDGVFAPSCIDHEILTSNHWSRIAISGISLGQALQSWMDNLPITILAERGRKRRLEQPINKVSPRLVFIDNCSTVNSRDSINGTALRECAKRIPLLPLCNESCLGQRRSLYRLSILDLLELHQVKSSALSTALGIDDDSLKLMNQEDQIKTLFCSARSRNVQNLLPLHLTTDN